MVWINLQLNTWPMFGRNVKIAKKWLSASSCLSIFYLHGTTQLPLDRFSYSWLSFIFYIIYIFWKSIKCDWNLTRKMGTFCEDPWILLRMRNFSKTKVIEKRQHLMAFPVQLSFKFHSPTHCTRHLILAPEG